MNLDSAHMTVAVDVSSFYTSTLEDGEQVRRSNISVPLTLADFHLCHVLCVLEIGNDYYADNVA